MSRVPLHRSMLLIWICVMSRVPLHRSMLLIWICVMSRVPLHRSMLLIWICVMSHVPLHRSMLLIWICVMSRVHLAGQVAVLRDNDFNVGCYMQTVESSCCFYCFVIVEVKQSFILLFLH